MYLDDALGGGKTSSECCKACKTIKSDLERVGFVILVAHVFGNRHTKFSWLGFDCNSIECQTQLSKKRVEGQFA